MSFACPVYGHSSTATQHIQPEAIDRTQMFQELGTARDKQPTIPVAAPFNRVPCTRRLVFGGQRPEAVIHKRQRTKDALPLIGASLGSEDSYAVPSSVFDLCGMTQPIGQLLCRGRNFSNSASTSRAVLNKKRMVAWVSLIAAVDKAIASASFSISFRDPSTASARPEDSKYSRPGQADSIPSHIPAWRHR